MTSQRQCWCGYGPLEPFNADYLRCPSCDTLVLHPMPDDIGCVEDDAEAFYGKDYWFAHQADMGLPDIVSRARLDFGDRLTAWLTSLLTYRTPPARSLELGCSHGGFVALLREAGFTATGLELSEKIAALARDLFDVPVLVGPIEAQALAPGSVDVVIAMDVLEHVVDPLETMRAVVEALAPSGLVMFQTPSYPAGATHAELLEVQHPFLSMLLPHEHTFLFSRRAMTHLLESVGLRHVAYQPAVFAQYDMLVLAAREPLSTLSIDEQEQAVLATPRGRLVQALLDRAGELRRAQATLARRDADVKSLEMSVDAAEADRVARLQVIEQQGAALGVATNRAEQLEAMVADLRAHLARAEADRQARLDVIERQGAELADAAQRAAESSARAETLTAHLAASEGDRAARLTVIEQQGEALDRLRGNAARVADLEAHVVTLEARLVACEDDRAARLLVIEQQGDALGQLTEEALRVTGLLQELASARARIDALETYATTVASSTGARALQRIGWIPGPPGRSS